MHNDETEPKLLSHLDLLEHELRTPIAGIQSAAEILSDHPDMPLSERRQFLEMVLDENRRLYHLVLLLLTELHLSKNRSSRASSDL